jgi:hypothetical protein
MAPHGVAIAETLHDVAVPQSSDRQTVTFEETVYAAMAAPKRPTTAARHRPVSARTKHKEVSLVDSATLLMTQEAVQKPAQACDDHTTTEAAAPTVGAEASLISNETAAATAKRKKRPLSAKPKRATTATSSLRRPQSAQTRQHETAAALPEDGIVRLASAVTQHPTGASQQASSQEQTLLETRCDESNSVVRTASDAQPTAAATVADDLVSSTPRASIMRSQSAGRKRSAGLTAAAAARTRKSILSRRPSSAPQQSLQLNIQPPAADAAAAGPRTPRMLRPNMHKQLHKPNAQSQLLRAADAKSSSAGEALKAVSEQQQQQQKRCTGAQEPSMIDLGGSSTAVGNSNGVSPHPPNSTSATAATRPRSATTVRQQQHKQQPPQQQRAASAGAKRQPPPVSILGLDLELIVVTEGNSNQHQQQQQQSSVVASSDSARRASGGRLALAFTIGMPMCAAFWPRVRPRIPAALRKGGMLRSRMKGIVIGVPRPRAGLTVSKRRPYVDRQGDPFEGGW